MAVVTGAFCSGIYELNDVAVKMESQFRIDTSSGAMMSLSLVAIPVLLDTTTDATQLLDQWTCLYQYGGQFLPPIAICTVLLYLYICKQKRAAKRPWRILALAGITTVSVIPFTLLIMVPTNNELLRLQAASEAEPLVLFQISGAKELVVRWTRLHLTRSLFPLAGAVLGTLGTF